MRIRWLVAMVLLVASGAGLAGCRRIVPSAEPPATTDGAAMVRVPAGEFTMGSSMLNQQPAHPVFLGEYWIDTYEVTNALYRKCVSGGGCPEPAQSRSSTRVAYYGNPKFDNFPKNLVTWDLADQYCRWAGKHLPTEAQWEKAARGTDGRKFPWGNDWDAQKAHSVFDNVYDTFEVGSYPDGASPYGALDMAGNLWEWVSDWYQEDYYSFSPKENPAGPETGTTRILRGGGYGVYDAAMYASGRRERLGAEDGTYVGFRCAY